MLEFLTEILHATVDLLQRVKFDKGNPVHRSLISLYATIIEQTDSAVTLLTKERWTGVNHLLRSAFEAHVDLINLTNDEAYLDQMMAAYHREWIKFTGEGVKGENPYLIFFKDNPEALEQLAYHKAELERIRANGPTLNIFERFEKAGLERRAYFVNLSIPFASIS